MKKRRVMALACAIVLLAGLQNGIPLVISDGFSGDDAFRVTAVGYPHRSISNDGTDRVRASACEAAKLNAQFGLVEKLADAGLSKVKGSVKCTGSRARMVKSVSGFIRGTTIVNESFDPHRRCCSVTMELREDGLREKVNVATAKANGSCR